MCWEALSAEWRCSHFITHDGRILRKRDDLQDSFAHTLHIVTLAEFLDTYVPALDWSDLIEYCASNVRPDLGPWRGPARKLTARARQCELPAVEGRAPNAVVA